MSYITFSIIVSAILWIICLFCEFRKSNAGLQAFSLVGLCVINIVDVCYHASSAPEASTYNLISSAIVVAVTIFVLIRRFGKS